MKSARLAFAFALLFLPAAALATNVTFVDPYGSGDHRIRTQPAIPAILLRWT